MNDKTYLIEKMEKALALQNFQAEEMAIDILWLTDGNLKIDDYLWFVKKDGSDIMPLHLALARGSYENEKAHRLADKDAKGYLIKVSNRDNETVDGTMTEIRNLENFLQDMEKTPSSITMSYLLPDGKMEEISTDWHPNYREAIKEKLGAAYGEVTYLHVSKII